MLSMPISRAISRSSGIGFVFRSVKFISDVVFGWVFARNERKRSF
jgi:hypothetical protein